MRLKVANLTPGTNYALQVRAVGASDTSEYSERFLLSTDQNLTAPAVPTGETWAVSGDSFIATWEPVTLDVNGDPVVIVGYELELTADAQTKIVSAGALTDEMSYTLSFSANMALFGTAEPSVGMRVRAVNNKNVRSAWTTIIVATNAVPAAPTSLTVVEISDGLRISWTPGADDDVVSYNIYIGTSSNPTTKVATTTSNPYTYNSLTFVEHFVRVKAVDKFGQESAYSNEDSGTPDSPFVIDTDAPDAPVWTSVVITNEDDNTLITRQIATLTWTHPGESDLAGFHVRYRKVSTTPWAAVDVDPDARTLVIVLPEPFVEWEFEIRAYDLYVNKSAWVNNNPSPVTTYTPPEFIEALIIGGGGYIESQSFGSGIGFRIDEDSITILDGAINGSIITTGVIHSTEPALDDQGDPITGEFAWQIDLEGDAVFGDVKVRGSIVVGEGEGAGDQLSVVQSGNYVPGESGWLLRSDGFAELRNLAANSIDGNVVKTESLTVNSLASGELGADIDLKSTITAYGEMGEEVRLGINGFSVLGPDIVKITNKALTSNVVTLTTVDDHGFVAGGRIVVKLDTPDASFDGEYFIDTVPTTTTFTYAKTASNVTSVAATGIVNGRDYAGNHQGPKYVDFPTDGTQPNIISGQLTADRMTVTGGATLRGTSGIEKGAKLVIDNDVLAPKNAPVVNFKYKDTALQGVVRNIFASTVGHNDNIFVLSSNGLNDYALTEHDPDTGQLVGTIFEDDGSGFSSISITMRGLVYSSTNDYYYVYKNESHRGGVFQDVDVYDSTWTKIDDYTIGSNIPLVGPAGDYLENVYFGTIGWDHANDRLMFVKKEDGASLLVRTYTMTSGVPTAINNSVTLTSTTGAYSPSFISRGNFDFGATRIVYKDRAYSSSVTVKRYFYVTNTSGTAQTNEHWDTPYGANMYGAWWNSTTSKFYAVSGSKTILEFQNGDSVWTTGTNKRWIAYSWRDSVGTTHETNLSPRISVTMPKRSQMEITIAPIPIGLAGVNDPDSARVYVAVQSDDPGVDGTEWKLRPTITYPFITGKVDPNQSIGSEQPVTTNEFLLVSSTPGMIESSTGNSFWKGDDTAQFYGLILTSGSDVTATAGNVPPLRIGNVNGAHMRVDSNEFQAMSDDDTATSLILNAGGGAVNIAGGGGNTTINNAGGTINMSGADNIDFGGKQLTEWYWAKTTITTDASSQDTIAHNCGAAPTIVLAKVEGSNVWDCVISNYTSTTFTVTLRSRADNSLSGSGISPNISWIALRT